MRRTGFTLRLCIIATHVVGLFGCSAARDDRRTSQDANPVSDVEIAPGPSSSATIATRPSSSGDSAPGPDLFNPARATLRAPSQFIVRFETTAGSFDLSCNREWAPHGADRLFNLVKAGYFQDIAFFRVVKAPRPFVVQFGIHGDPEVNSTWRDATIESDPVVGSNRRGVVTFAMAGAPTTRSTQLFINLDDNSRLDQMGFAPVCVVMGAGMDVVDKLYDGYAEAPSREQGRINSEGNTFLRQNYPNLDYLVRGTLLPGRGW